MCTPVVRALRAHLPESYIAFLTEKESADILTLNPYLNEVIVLERERYRDPSYWLKKIWKIRRKRFDLVLDYLGNPRSAYISFLSGAKRRAGYDFPGRRLLYNLAVKNEGTSAYSAEHKLKLLKALGIESSDLRLDFFLPREAELFAKGFFREMDVDRRNLVVSISPTSRRHFRRWPLERFARLADWLIWQFKTTVVLVWGPGEKGAVERVEDMMKERPVISWRTSNLFQLGAILGECDLHIGNDNGIKHVAVAMGKPTITIYGPQDPKNWTYPDFSRHKFLKMETDCPDCDKMKEKCRALTCLDSITVDQVKETFLQLLKDLEKNEERGLVEKIKHPAID